MVNVTNLNEDMYFTHLKQARGLFDEGHLAGLIVE